MTDSAQPSTEFTVSMPAGDLYVADAYLLVDDPSYWDLTMPPMLLHYRLSLEDYGRLKVYQHRIMFDYLVAKGLADGLP